MLTRQKPSAWTFDEDPQEWCEITWRNYGPDGVTNKGWITRKNAP
jgi:hypothetical protein